MSSNPHHIVRHPMAYAGYFRPRTRRGDWETGYKHPLWDLAMKAATPEELYDTGTPDRNMATRFLDLNLNEDQLFAIQATRGKYNKKAYIAPPNAIFETEDWNLQEAMSEMIQWHTPGGPLHFHLTTPEERLYWAKEATTRYTNNYKKAQKYIDKLTKLQKAAGKLNIYGKIIPKGWDRDKNRVASILHISDNIAADIIKVWSKGKAQALIETFLRRYEGENS